MKAKITKLSAAFPEGEGPEIVGNAERKLRNISTSSPNAPCTRNLRSKTKGKFMKTKFSNILKFRLFSSTFLILIFEILISTQIFYFEVENDFLDAVLNLESNVGRGGVGVVGPGGKRRIVNPMCNVVKV